MIFSSEANEIKHSVFGKAGSSRELNFIAMEEMIEIGGFEPLELLKSLLKALGADEANDHLAYICRKHQIEIPCGKELELYEVDPQ